MISYFPNVRGRVQAHRTSKFHWRVYALVKHPDLRRVANAIDDSADGYAVADTQFSYVFLEQRRNQTVLRQIWLLGRELKPELDPAVSVDLCAGSLAAPALGIDGDRIQSHVRVRGFDVNG